MIKRLIVLSLLILCAFGFTAYAQQKTVINSDYAKRELLGSHLLSLQWISWDYFGRASITDKNGTLYLSGEQKGRGNSDYLKINGVITEVNRYEFKFNGKIITHVSYNNGGEPCIREGEMTFAITGKRKYWRLQEMNDPCEEIVDYVDIYFKK